MIYVFLPHSEDEALCALVRQHGVSSWTVIAAGVPGRSGKSCRLRWYNQLNPQVRRLGMDPALAFLPACSN
jgi:hypothetical protein